MPSLIGTIKRKLDEKGFGFILQEDGDQEYFFHRDTCDTPFAKLREGQRVQFEPIPGAKGKGPRAEQVKAI